MINSQTKFKQAEVDLVPEDWEAMKARDFCIKVADGTHDSPKQTEQGKYLITSRHLKDNQIDFDNAYLISDDDFSNINKRSKVDTNDILYSMIGTVGDICQVKERDINFAIKNIGLFKPKTELDSNWLYYYLQSNQAKEYLASRLAGSTQSYITLDQLREFPILLPKEPAEQKKIAEVLGALDEKIELNRKMDKTLEQIAQAVFKKWFIGDADPNWETKKLAEFGRVVCGKTPSKSNSEYFSGGVPFIKIPDMHGQTFIIKTDDSLTEEGQRSQPNQTIPAGSVCVSCIATVGLVSIASDESQTNQQINSIVPNKPEYTFFLYLKLKEIKQDLLDMASGGSATLNMNTGTFSNIRVNAPSDDELVKFDQQVRTLFENMLLNLKEIETLSQIRDSLLPRLMSGKLGVR